jgi:hypothetical protein
MWKANGKIFEKKTDTDLAEAVRLHALLSKADKKGVTLRCCNVGHPPPASVLEYEEEYVEEVVVKVKGRKRKVLVRRTKTVDKMNELNHEGIWWCPYCMKFRRFAATVWEQRQLMQCPMCDITTRDWHVRRWNPFAMELQYRKKTRGTR